MELHPLLHQGVVTIEKGAFWSPSTTFTNFILFSTDYFVVEQHFSVLEPRDASGQDRNLTGFTSVGYLTRHS